jgi:hypothetical protein
MNIMYYGKGPLAFIHLEIHGAYVPWKETSQAGSPVVHRLSYSCCKLELTTLKVKPTDGRMSHLRKCLEKCGTRTPKPFVSLKT